MASSSSCKFEVFLSFRGEDTRENFTSHLFRELSERKKIKTFIDEDLNRGDEISPALLNAIEGSMISIIILSKDYASSKWCLDELLKILQWKETNGQMVIPVFYHVHPSEVRYQRGCYADAFRKHEKNFRKMPAAGKVQNWRAALTEVSYLSGHESEKIRPDTKLIDVIVKDVLKKLEDLTVSTHSSGLVGIKYRIEKVKSLLHARSQDFQIVGIRGMGGIGKTTLAEAIFKQVSGDFEGRCFMKNVREKVEKGVGLQHLQKEVFSHLLEETLHKDDPNLPQYTLKRLRRTKAFIILDDVTKLEQLEYLAGRLGGPDLFGQGSKIIVTTRDKKVLDEYGVDSVYEVEELNSCEAREHFTNFAFRQSKCPVDLMDLSTRVVDYAKGNPLALKVLGSFLRSKNKLDWEIALHNLNRISQPDIFDVLKISYNDLIPDVKDIFLDIACFFKGDDKDHVISILDDYHLMHYGLGILNDKSLITISHNKLEMHDLLQEMGRDIVCQESQVLGKRSRLWHHKDICHVLTKSKGTDAIKGIFLNLSKIGQIYLDSKVFTNMPNLRLLKLYTVSGQYGESSITSKVHLPEGLDCLSDELRYLYWYGYPWRMLPKKFCPDNLIELSLPYSQVQQLWEENKGAPKLKFIDLQHSQYLTRIPNPLETPILERINLLNCINLSCIPSSMEHFNYLRLLCFSRCTSLTSLPPNIHFKSPIKIDFFECINLTVFPQISGNIIDLNLCGTAIEEVPSSIERLTSLEQLNLGCCKRLTNLSTSICKLKSLRRLDLFGCSKFERFPEVLEQMESLDYINLAGTKIKELPRSIELLTGLTKLDLIYCHELDSVPKNLGNLKYLNVIIGQRSAINRGKGLVLPPLSSLCNLREVYLIECDIVEIPQDIGCLSSLEILQLSGSNFESLPTSIKKLSQLRILYLNDCNMLQSLPELPIQLESLNARNCKRLESLQELPDCLEKLDAFPLQSFPQRSPEKLYLFNSCPRLTEKANNITADSQLRIQHMVVALLKRSHLCKKNGAAFRFYLPGSGHIPEWLSNGSSGSSITFQLPQYSCSRNFIGFGLWAVFGFEEDSHASDQEFYVHCSYHFETKTSPITEHFGGTDFSRLTFIKSDQVFLGFDPCWTVRLPDGDHDAAVTIDFSINDHFHPPYEAFPKVKCCGVRPMYAHLNESPSNTFTVNMVSPTEEEYTQIMNLNKDSTTTEEEVKASPKTISRENINAPDQQGSLFSLLSLVCSRRVGLFLFLIIFVPLLQGILSLIDVYFLLAAIFAVLLAAAALAVR